MFKKLKQRGQVLVFYAFMIPTVFLFVGAVADIGWYYLNVSRLQNAADAAVLAGAQAIVQDGSAFEKYFVVSLANNDLPADFDDYKDVYRNTFDSTTSAAGNLSNYRKESEVQTTLNTGRYFAEEYARKNLSDSKEVSVSTNNVYAISATDGWNASSNDSGKKVTGTLGLKYKIVDGKNDVYGPLYYVVNLEEKIRHFLLPGWFDPMSAKVRAVALLRPHYIGLIEPIQQLERTQVIDNWEYANAYKGTSGAYNGNWGHYQAGVKGGNNYGIRYTSGNAYRQESVIVKATAKATDGKSVTKSSEGTSLKTTNANNNWVFDVNKVDSINIDFRAEVKGKFSSDWDLGYAFPESGHSYQFTNDNSWSATDGANKRILFNVEFDEAFAAREDVIRNHPNPNDNRNADPLWVRIESDPLKNPYNGAGVSNFNSVRQITLNFNNDNTSVKSDSDGNYYEYRPYFFFYTGPENIDYATDANGVLIRHSQPVVVNLNENLNAIMYFPESPVVINGNGNTWRGFIVAKCFLSTVTSEDMTTGNSIILWDGFNAKKTFRGDYTEGTDGNDSTVYFKPETLVAREQISATYSGADYNIVGDDSSAVITVQRDGAPKYLLLKYSKADSVNPAYEVKEEYNGTLKRNENKTFDNYVNATYKETFKNFSGLDDSQITAVTFPDEKQSAATYYVANSALSSSKENDNYVKVMADGVEKYVDKKRLPYVKVRTNKEYFYVCVYDLKVARYPAEGSFTSVRMIDNDYTDEQLGDSSTYKSKNITTVTPTGGTVSKSATKSEGDIYDAHSENTITNEWGDTWKLVKTWYSSEHSKWKKDKVEFGEKGGVTYFILKAEMTGAEIIARYHKITYDDGSKVGYAKEGNGLYYTKVFNNATNHDNYIIVDENGNMLTKPVTSPEVLTAKTQTENENLEDEATSYFGTNATLSSYWNEYTREPKDPEEIPGDRGGINIDGRYIGMSSYRVNDDYRIPALERVYKKSTFNLSANSYYSYFDIEVLKRVNYIYMNVDELNETVDNGLSPEKIKEGELWKVDDMFFTYERAKWID